MFGQKKSQPSCINEVRTTLFTLSIQPLSPSRIQKSSLSNSHNSFSHMRTVAPQMSLSSRRNNMTPMTLNQKPKGRVLSIVPPKQTSFFSTVTASYKSGEDQSRSMRNLQSFGSATRTSQLLRTQAQVARGIPLRTNYMD